MSGQARRADPGLPREGRGVRARGGARGLQEAGAAAARPRLRWGRDTRKRIPFWWRREPRASEGTGGRLLSNPRGGGRRRPGRPHPPPRCSWTRAPPSAPRPPRPSPAPAPARSGQVEPGSGRARGPQQLLPHLASALRRASRAHGWLGAAAAAAAGRRRLGGGAPAGRGAGPRRHQHAAQQRL